LSSDAPAPTGSARRWRVLVLANSVSLMAPGRTSRAEGPYAEVLETLLIAEGIDAEVRNAGRWYEQIDRGVHRFQEEERAWSPDVVVVQYGINECQAPVLPRAVHHHFMTWETGLRRPARAYRRHLAPAAWSALRAYQRWATARIGMHGWRMAPRRFSAHLARLIALARWDHRLVLVIDLNRPGPRMVHHLPGIDARRDRYQAAVAEAVASAGDRDARLVAASSVVDDLGLDAALPDGLHWSPLAHRRVAEMLAAEIVPWIRSHPGPDAAGASRGGP
jgi:lysophospholipase L1-like esterase